MAQAASSFNITIPNRLGTRLVTNAQDTNYFEQQTLPFGTALNESPPAGATTGFTNRRFTTYDRQSEHWVSTTPSTATTTRNKAASPRSIRLP